MSCVKIDQLLLLVGTLGRLINGRDVREARGRSMISLCYPVPRH